MRGACVELPLPLWTVEAVEAWLAALGHDAQLAARLAGLLHQRTEGHPLFLRHVLEALHQQGVLTLRQGRWQVHGDVEAAVHQVPESLRLLIAYQLDHLAPEAHAVLQVGSVMGPTFAAAAMAAHAGYEVEVVEEICEALAQRQHLVQAAGVEAWPDGTVSARYAFRHALYSDVLYHTPRPWSCAPPPAWRACGSSTSARTPTTCSRPSMLRAPRALPRRIYRKRRRCCKIWRDSQFYRFSLFAHIPLSSLSGVQGRVTLRRKSPSGS